MLYTLYLYSDLCQLFLNKTREQQQQQQRFDSETCDPREFL